MALSEIDKNLLDRCLQNKSGAWKDFVDRFIGLISHVVRHTAQTHGSIASRDDYGVYCNEVFLTILKDDYAVLRHFRGQCSLASYLTVIARRRIIQIMSERKVPVVEITDDAEDDVNILQYLYNREEVEELLNIIPASEAAVVRLFYFDQMSYEQISQELGIPVNSVGPVLHRARARMRNKTK